MIGTVLATDADAGSNGQVAYSIASGSTQEFVAVDSMTGDVSLLVPSDFETLSSQTLQVSPSPSPSPSPRLVLAPKS